MRRVRRRKNALPLLAIPAVITGIKVVGSAAALYLTARVGVRLYTGEDKLAFRQLDTAKYMTRYNELDYQALDQAYMELVVAEQSGQTWTEWPPPFTRTNALTASPMNTAQAYLQASVYYMLAYMYTKDARLKEWAIKSTKEGSTASFSIHTDPSAIAEIIKKVYLDLLGTPFPNEKIKEYILNRIIQLKETLNITFTQEDKIKQDEVTREEVSFAECGENKVWTGVKAAFLWQSKPVCMTKKEWLWYRIGIWGGGSILLLGLLSTPLAYLSTAGKLAGASAKQVKLPKLKNVRIRY